MKSTVRDFAARLPLVISGFVAAAFGLALMIQSRLGMGPWGALEVGVSKLTGLSVGVVTQAISLALVLLSWALAVPPTLVTILNAFSIGFFMDLALRVLPKPEAWLARGAFFVGGLGIYSFGIAFYLVAAAGDSGPRESLMLAVSRSFRASVRVSRIAVDLFALALAFLAKGPIGIGTVAFAFVAGPLIQFFLRLRGYATIQGKFSRIAGDAEGSRGDGSATPAP